MATAEEYGVQKDYPIPKEHRDRIIQQPSPEWIEKFGEWFEEIDYDKRRPATHGKFVVVRHVVLVAPFPHIIQHHQILSESQEDDALRRLIEAQRALAAKESIPLLPAPDFKVTATDAGMFLMTGGGSLMVTGRSDFFGRGDDKQRQRTVAAFEEALNEEVSVLSMDVY